MNTKPVILQVLPALEQGGVEVGTLEMGRYLVRQGYTSLVASAGGQMVQALEQEGSQHFVLPLKNRTPWFIFYNALQLTKLIKQHRVQVIHARSRGPAWSVWLASKITGIPYVTTFHGIYGHSHFFKRFYNSSMLRGKLVAANSRYTLKHIQDVYHTPNHQLVLAPRGYDESKFNVNSVSSAAIQALRDAWELPEKNTPVIIKLGRISPWKGHAVLFSALARIKDKPWICVIVGTGPAELTTSLQQQCVDLGIADRVKWLGYQNNTPLYLAAADICISASVHPEAFGRTVIEAQAMGTPVLATNHGGPMELIDQGRTGWLVAPDNAEAIAIQLAEILSDERLVKKDYAGICRQWASQFTTEMMCLAETSMYNKILGLPHDDRQ